MSIVADLIMKPEAVLAEDFATLIDGLWRMRDTRGHLQAREVLMDPTLTPKLLRVLEYLTYGGAMAQDSHVDARAVLMRGAKLLGAYAANAGLQRKKVAT